MKRIFCILFSLLIFATATVGAQEVEDVLGVSKLKFNGTKYQLGWSAHNSLQYMQEYFPKGQVPESYTDMFTISVTLAPNMIAKTACEAKVAELAQRKETQKDVWNWAVSHNEDGSEWIVDFICCQGNAEKLDIVEFDVHRYRMIDVDGFPALQLLFYSHRVYGDDIMPFMKEKLADLRLESVAALIKFDVDCQIKTK